MMDYPKHPQQHLIDLSGLMYIKGSPCSKFWCSTAEVEISGPQSKNLDRNFVSAKQLSINSGDQSTELVSWKKIWVWIFTFYTGNFYRGSTANTVKRKYSQFPVQRLAIIIKCTIYKIKTNSYFNTDLQVKYHPLKTREPLILVPAFRHFIDISIGILKCISSCQWFHKSMIENLIHHNNTNCSLSQCLPAFTGIINLYFIIIKQENSTNKAWVFFLIYILN